LFDLTPAEARVACSLAAGDIVETIATSRGVSQNTIRMHVRGVLEKTGCNRQADMIALLTAISPARLPHPAPCLTRHQLRKSQKISRALSILIRRQLQRSISFTFIRSQTRFELTRHTTLIQKVNIPCLTDSMQIKLSK
jgi:DNA-binding CsgD family transcriptional regulator